MTWCPSCQRTVAVYASKSEALQANRTLETTRHRCSGCNLELDKTIVEKKRARA